MFSGCFLGRSCVTAFEFLFQTTAAALCKPPRQRDQWVPEGVGVSAPSPVCFWTGGQAELSAHISRSLISWNWDRSQSLNWHSWRASSFLQWGMMVKWRSSLSWLILAAYMTLGKPCFPGANRYKISPRENNSENNPLNVWGELSLQFWFSE